MYPKKELCPPDCYNLWTGFAAEAMDPINPSDEVIQKGLLCLLEHFKMLTDGNEAQYEFLLDWIAHMVQYPNHKIGIMLCLVGLFGVGKTKVFELIHRMIGERGCFGTHTPERDVTGDNNVRMAECFFCRIEEVKKSQLADAVGALRTIIMDGKIRIRQLFCSPEFVTNYTRFFLDTNWFDAIPDEHGERRYFIIMCSAAKIGDADYWNELSAAIDDDRIVRAFYDFLLARPGVKPHYFGKDIPVGKYQKDLKDANRSEIDKFVQGLIEREPLVETGWVKKGSRHLGIIAKKLGMGDGDPTKEASLVQSITTRLGIAHIEGTKSDTDTSSGKVERVWSFNRDTLRKRYGLEALARRAQEREKAVSAARAEHDLEMAAYQKEKQEYDSKKRARDDMTGIGYRGGNAPPPLPDPPVEPVLVLPNEAVIPDVANGDAGALADQTPIDCEEDVADWLVRALARVDGTAATGDLTNKNEAFVKEVNTHYNQWFAGQYTAAAATGARVSIDPSQQKQTLGEIVSRLEHEWMEAGTSWAPEGAMTAGAAPLPGAALQPDGGGPSGGPLVHPASPSGGGSSGMDVEGEGGGVGGGAMAMRVHAASQRPTPHRRPSFVATDAEIEAEECESALEARREEMECDADDLGDNDSERSDDDEEEDDEEGEEGGGDSFIEDDREARKRKRSPDSASDASDDDSSSSSSSSGPSSKSSDSDDSDGSDSEEPLG
jgi:hypothetical protein